MYEQELIQLERKYRELDATRAAYDKARNSLSTFEHAVAQDGHARVREGEDKATFPEWVRDLMDIYKDPVVPRV